MKANAKLYNPQISVCKQYVWDLRCSEILGSWQLFTVV